MKAKPKFAVKLPTPLERDIQRNILDYLRFRGVWCWRNQSQGTWDAVKARYRSSNTIRGVPDILGILAPTGRLLAIEVKRPGAVKRASPEQLHFLRQASDAGALAFVADSVDLVRQQLDHALA